MLGQLLGISPGQGGATLALLASQHQVTQPPPLLPRQGFQVIAASLYRGQKLLRPAMEALKAQKAHTFLADAEVFQNPRTLERWAGDGPIRKTMWVPAMKKAGVRYRRPYQTRHTYASMMLSAGEHPMWVAKQMGHTDWTMIARVYGRWMPSGDEEAGFKAERAFASVTPTLTKLTRKP